MVFLYNTLFYQPLLNTLIFFYQTISFKDLGLAIILLTVLIRLILYPVFRKSVHHQMVMQKIQPEIKKIQEQHKDAKEQQSQALLNLFKENNVNPFSGFLLLLIQFPVLIALYQIFLHIITPGPIVGLYSFVVAPENLNPMFLGLLNLGQSNIVMVGLAAATQFLQGYLAQSQMPQGGSPTEQMARRMVWLAPIMTLLVFSHLPAAISLYWVVTTVFSIGQQILVQKQINQK